MSKSDLKTLGYAISQVNRLWNQQFMAILQSKGYYNLKPSFAAVFLPLFENNGQSTAELARATHMTKQTMSIYVHALCKRGYLKVIPDTQDKRIHRIFLTAKGSMLQTTFESASEMIGIKLCAHLNKHESQELMRLLSSIPLQKLF